MQRLSFNPIQREKLIRACIEEEEINPDSQYEQKVISTLHTYTK